MILQLYSVCLIRRKQNMNFELWLPRPLLVTLEVRTATLGLVKCLEINKELIRECVTMPGCCCCMPLLHDHLIDSCSYVRKNTLLAAFAPPLPPLNPPLHFLWALPSNNAFIIKLVKMWPGGTPGGQNFEDKLRSKSKSKFHNTVVSRKYAPPFATLASVQNAGGLVRAMRRFLSRLRPPFRYR